MRKLIYILILIPFVLKCQVIVFKRNSAPASGYYVSNSGSDSNDGRSESTPWATISKVNSTTIDSGAVVYFERGSEWYETLIAQKGVRYDAYGSGGRPAIIVQKPLSFVYYDRVGGSAYDTTYQSSTATGTNSTGNISAYRVYIGASGTIVKYLVYTDTTSIVTKCALYDKSLSLVANTTSNEKLSQDAGWNEYTVSSGATVSADSFWIAIQGDGVHSIPYGTSGARNDYFWASGTYSAFPPSSISSPTYYTKENAPIGVVIQTSSSSGYDTIWVATSDSTVYGGRFANGEGYWKEVSSYADLDAYNEVYLKHGTPDSVFAYDENVGYAYFRDAIYDTVDYTYYKNLYLKGARRALYNTGTHTTIDSCYFLMSKYGVYNTGNTHNYVRRSDFVYTNYGLFNTGRIDSAYYNEFERANLIDGHSVYNSGIMKLYNNSFYSNDTGGALVYTTNTLTMKNNNLKGLDTLINTTVNKLTSDYNCFDNFKAVYQSTYYNNLTDWQINEWQDANSKTGIHYSDPDNFDLTLTSSSNSINAGVNLGFKKDKYGNTVPQKDTVDIGSYESGYNSPSGGGSDYGAATEFVYVRSDGTTSWSNRTDSTLGITMKTLNANISNLKDKSQVLFKAGQTFMDSLVINSLNPDADSTIIFGRFGSGSNPKISGLVNLPDWDNTASWTKINDTTYSYKFGVTLTYPIKRLWLGGTEYPFAHDGSPYHPEIGDSMAFGSTYRWKPKPSAGSVDSILVYVPSGKHPATYYSSIKWNGGNSKSGNDEMINITNSSNLAFYDLTIEGGLDRIIEIGKSSNIVVKDCELYNMNEKGIVIAGGTARNNQILNNTIDSKLDLIYGAPIRYEIEDMNLVDIEFGSDSNVVANNYIANGGISHIRVINNPSSSWGSDEMIDNVIRDNHLFVSQKKARGKSISVNTSVTDSTYMPLRTLIYRNFIETVGQAQIGGRETKVYYNIFKNQTRRDGYYIVEHYYDSNESYRIPVNDKGIVVWTDDGRNNIRDVLIFNNTFYKMGREAIQTGNGNNAKVFNNLMTYFNIDSTFDNHKVCSYIKDWTTSMVKNNMSYDSLDTDYKSVYHEDGGSFYYRTWSEFEVAFGSGASGNFRDTVSASYSDIFYDVNNDDFSPVSGCLAIDGGINITAYVDSGFTDRDGNVVDRTQPNIGAVDN